MPINATVNATFSEAMDPLTITTATFQLTGPGGAVITGTVAYDAINFIATFTPSSNLAVSTIYVAEITTSVTDLAGNPLEAGLVPNPWTFTTGLAVAPPPPSCGTACAFGGFRGGAGMTNQGLLTVINGDIGTTGASTLMTGFHDTTEPYLQFTTGCIYTETPLDVGTVNGEYIPLLRLPRLLGVLMKELLPPSRLQPRPQPMHLPCSTQLPRPKCHAPRSALKAASWAL